MIHDTEAVCSWSALAEIPQGSSVRVELKDCAGNVAAAVTHRHNELVIDRSMNPCHEGDPLAVAPLTSEDTDSMYIFVDGSSVEVFADGGYVAMASRVYFNEGCCDSFEVSVDGDAEIMRSDEQFPDDFSSTGLPDWDDLPEFDDSEPDEGPVR